MRLHGDVSQIWQQRERTIPRRRCDLVFLYTPVLSVNSKLAKKLPRSAMVDRRNRPLNITPSRQQSSQGESSGGCCS